MLTLSLHSLFTSDLVAYLDWEIDYIVTVFTQSNTFILRTSDITTVQFKVCFDSLDELNANVFALTDLLHNVKVNYYD